MQKYPGSFSRSLSRVQVSTMAVKDDLIVAGGFHGELICKVHYFKSFYSLNSKSKSGFQFLTVVYVLIVSEQTWSFLCHKNCNR